MIQIENNFEKQSSHSYLDAKNIVYPKIFELKFLTGHIKSIETYDHRELIKQFDLKAGMDAILINKNDIQPISNRIQWGCNYRTFTIRWKKLNEYKTEYDKFKYAIDNDGFLPTYMIQSYIINGKLVSIGIAKLKDIMAMVNFKKYKRNKQDGTLFLIVNWDDLKGKIKTWDLMNN